MELKGRCADRLAPAMSGQASVLLALYPDVDRAYLDERIRTEAAAIMASKTFPPTDEQPIIDMETFGRELVARRAAAGDPVTPRNAGTRRTPSKRALLAAIEKAGGTW